MATLTPVPVPVDGGLIVAGVPAAPGGDEAPTGNGRLLHVALAAAAGAPVTVTVATPGTVQGLAVADVAASIDPGESWLLPLTSVFRNPTTGRASVTYSSATNVTVAVLEPDR